MLIRYCISSLDRGVCTITKERFSLFISASKVRIYKSLRIISGMLEVLYACVILSLLRSYYNQLIRSVICNILSLGIKSVAGQLLFLNCYIFLNLVQLISATCRFLRSAFLGLLSSLEVYSSRVIRVRLSSLFIIPPSNPQRLQLARVITFYSSSLIGPAGRRILSYLTTLPQLLQSLAM